MIRLREVSKRFAERRVLDRLSLEVEAGQIYGLLGPNGSGKSTTINLICGRLQADSGRVQVNAAAGRAQLGVATQEVAVYADASCRSQLDFFARLYGLDRARRARRIEQLLHSFELTDYADTPAQQLSGGWRRRLHLAIALVHAPWLLILDEPTASVDLAARHALWRIIREQRDAGTTVLLTTHHLDEAEQLCDRIGILHDGRLLAEGRPEQIRARVPAQQIALLDADELPPLRQRAGQLGFHCRDYGGRLGVLLPQAQSMSALVQLFNGVALRSLALSPVTLEHAYLHLLGAGAVEATMS